MSFDKEVTAIKALKISKKENQFYWLSLAVLEPED